MGDWKYPFSPPCYVHSVEVAAGKRFSPEVFARNHKKKSQVIPAGSTAAAAYG